MYCTYPSIIFFSKLPYCTTVLLYLSSHHWQIRVQPTHRPATKRDVTVRLIMLILPWMAHGVGNSVLMEVCGDHVYTRYTAGATDSQCAGAISQSLTCHHRTSKSSHQKAHFCSICSFYIALAGKEGHLPRRSRPFETSLPLSFETTVCQR